MESSWRQMAVLCFGAGSRIEFCARIREPTLPHRVLYTGEIGGVRAGYVSPLDTGGWAEGPYIYTGDSGRGFPWGHDVYGDDVLPPPWP